MSISNHLLEARLEQGRVCCARELDGLVPGCGHCNGKDSQCYDVESGTNRQKSFVLDAVTMSEPSRIMESGADWKRPPGLLCKRASVSWHNHR